MTYILKVWFTTILVSPVLLCLILGVITSDAFFDILPLSMLMIVFGFVFSIPTIFAQLITTIVLERMDKHHSLIKIVLSIFAVLGIYLSFYIIKVSFVQFIGPLIYSVTMTSSIWYFKFTNGKTQTMH